MSQLEYVTQVDGTLSQSHERSYFGKMKVLINSSFCAVTIGPDYCFFIPTFSLFLIAGIATTTVVFKESSNIYFRLITLLVCLGQPLSYLNVALSNPGIVSRSVVEIPIDQISTLDILETADEQYKKKSVKHKYCKKCNIFVKPTTYHCSDCQICIEEYDHHCPWVSKCIGKNNLTKFYIFLAMTPVFMLYSFVSFVACSALDIDKSSMPNL